MAEIKKLCVLPEGKPAWITQDESDRLWELYNAVDFPDEGDIDNLLEEGYAKLYAYLVYVCKLDKLPVSRKSIHYNAFEMFRRGVKDDNTILITKKENS